ncbi:hypothetical protein C8F04DRAFT_1095484 [Mycena alexandri]|uniref:Zinc finger PHD-type domain-containing protein n=1 Tax=Mycena alexandri TaxID=1745969 RepID=A0AAD6X2E8_9AGAR|nr:hypothetical protein C8F04DRAFT_1095484 [Mycena alexandri]
MDFAAPGVAYANPPMSIPNGPPPVVDVETVIPTVVQPPPVTPSAVAVSAPLIPPTQIAVTQTGRPQRSKTKRRDRDEELNCCDCGVAVTPAEKTDTSRTIECTKAGCESGWYHVECVDIGRPRKVWVCKSCGGGKRTRW